MVSCLESINISHSCSNVYCGEANALQLKFRTYEMLGVLILPINVQSTSLEHLCLETNVLQLKFRTYEKYLFGALMFEVLILLIYV